MLYQPAFCMRQALHFGGVPEGRGSLSGAGAACTGGVFAAPAHAAPKRMGVEAQHAGRSVPWVQAWVEWDALVREDRLQRAANRCGKSLCHSHSPFEARADGRGGLAPYASAHGSLDSDAPAESGPEHAGPGVGGDAHLLHG